MFYDKYLFLEKYLHWTGVTCNLMYDHFFIYLTCMLPQLFWRIMPLIRGPSLLDRLSSAFDIDGEPVSFPHTSKRADIGRPSVYLSESQCRQVVIRVVHEVRVYFMELLQKNQMTRKMLYIRKNRICRIYNKYNQKLLILLIKEKYFRRRKM